MQNLRCLDAKVYFQKVTEETAQLKTTSESLPLIGGVFPKSNYGHKFCRYNRVQWNFKHSLKSWLTMLLTHPMIVHGAFKNKKIIIFQGSEILLHHK